MKWMMSLFAIVVVGILATIAMHESGFDVSAPDWSGMTLVYLARAALEGLAVVALILIATNALFPRSSLKNGGEDQGKRADLEARIVENVNYLFKEALENDLMPAFKQQIEAARLESRAPEDEYNQLRQAIGDLRSERDRLVTVQEQHTQTTQSLQSQQEIANDRLKNDSLVNSVKRAADEPSSGVDGTASDKMGDFGE